MTKSVPRKHHIIPASYLAAFTPSGTRRDKLFVFDHGTGKQYRTSPDKACRETDYYRIEAEGAGPSDIEDVLAWHEGVVAPHVKALAQGKVTDRRQVGETIAFAASIAARNRRGRAQLEEALAASLGLALSRGEVSRELWERMRESELRHTAFDPSEFPTTTEPLSSFGDGSGFPMHQPW